MEANHNHGKRYDWPAIRADYVSDPTASLRSISEKYGVTLRLVQEHSRKEGWFAARKKYIKDVSDKAVAKVTTKQANKLARLMTATDKVTECLEKALEDPEQFNRYFVPETYSSGGETISSYVDKVSPKLDTKSLKEVAQALKILEDVQRSLHNIRKAEDLDKSRREADRLKLEREKFEWEKEKTSKQDGEAGESGVLILPEVLQEDDDGKE